METAGTENISPRNIRQTLKAAPKTSKTPQRALRNSQDLLVESDRLHAAWMRHDSDVLDRYLVIDCEDPRINMQSIITRAFLIDTLFPDEFTSLIREEFRFSICLNCILRLITTTPQVTRRSILNALERRTGTSPGIELPSYLRRALDLLRRKSRLIPDYITQALIDSCSDPNVPLPTSALSAFQQTWDTILAHRQADRISVLEPACGSANDYRFLNSFGVSRFLDYTGFDICDKNIANARSCFPSVHFETANVLDIPAADNSFEFLFVHDLFEHLSGDALRLALAEISRVTRKQACLSFFRMADISDHEIKPVGLYYCNTLSLRAIRRLLAESASDIDVVHIDTFLKSSYACPDFHNKNAYTLIVTFDKG